MPEEAMDRLANVDREQLVERMRADFEQTMGRLADAVNAAPDGHLIDGSEEKARDLLNEFRRVAFQTAAQLRVEATEASPAFSPGRAVVAQAGEGEPVGGQLPGAGGAGPAEVPKAGRPRRRPGR